MVVLKVCPRVSEVPTGNGGLISSMAARRSDSRVGVQGLPPSSTGCQLLTPFLPLIYLLHDSPVPTEVVAVEAMAVHVSRTPMHENKTAASQKHRCLQRP